MTTCLFLRNGLLGNDGGFVIYNRLLRAHEFTNISMLDSPKGPMIAANESQITLVQGSQPTSQEPTTLVVIYTSQYLPSSSSKNPKSATNDSGGGD